MIGYSSLSYERFKQDEREFITVLGPQNSGTNLVCNLFFLQDRAENNQEQNRLDDEFTRRNRVWKHEHHINKLEKLLNDPNRKIICVYRDVYTWLNSMKKESYETQWDGNLTSPVYNGEYSSIIELYKNLYNNYMILKSRSPRNVIFCRYYDLIDPKYGYDYYKSLTEQLGTNYITKQHYLEILSKPAKSHGGSVSNSLESISKKEDDIFSERERDYITYLLNLNNCNFLQYHELLC